MKKGILAVLLTGILYIIGSISVFAAAVNEPSQPEETVQETQELVESLDGIGTVELAEVSVEIFDINSVEYEGGSVFPIVAAAVGIVAVIAVSLIIYALKERDYEEV